MTLKWVNNAWPYCLLCDFPNSLLEHFTRYWWVQHSSIIIPSMRLRNPKQTLNVYPENQCVIFLSKSEDNSPASSIVNTMLQTLILHVGHIDPSPVYLISTSSANYVIIDLSTFFNNYFTSMLHETCHVLYFTWYNMYNVLYKKSQYQLSFCDSTAVVPNQCFQLQYIYTYLWHFNLHDRSWLCKNEIGLIHISV